MKKQFYTTEQGFEPLPTTKQQLIQLLMFIAAVLALFLPVLLFAVDKLNGTTTFMLYAFSVVSFFIYQWFTAPVKKQADDLYLQRHRQSCCLHPLDSLFTNELDARTFCKDCGAEIDLKTGRAVVKAYEINEAE